MDPPHQTLAVMLSETRLAESDVRDRLVDVHHGLLETSRYVRQSNFSSIHVADLEWLFAAYDQRFFAGLIGATVPRPALRFRLSTRMTKAGGKTTTFRTGIHQVRYEIAISCGLLFDAFREGDRPIAVCGVPCATRLDALQRIFEHELVHLLEQVCWGTSDCAAERFQDVASRFFLHRSHQHQLITRGERAAHVGIRPGARVRFVYEGRTLAGLVNRITTRATVLVEDPAGRPFSDGRRYLTYYVPVGALTLDC